MRPSEWPLRYKMLASAILTGAMALIGGGVYAIVKDLPLVVLTHLAVGMISMGIGGWIADASAARVLKRRLGTGADDGEDAP